MIRFFLSIGLLIFCFSVQAQNYVTNGTAVALNDSCYQITAPILDQIGTVWNDQQIDLTQDFDIRFIMYLGTNDSDGADGIVFSFQDVGVNAIGTTGGGMGFESFAPSLGIEFDTWQNNDLYDPFDDHVALVSNGVNNHAAPENLAGPNAVPNLEDGTEHIVNILWDANQMELEVLLDCVSVLNANLDIVNDVFLGDNLVYWGFTGSTGGLSNQQYVCLAPYAQELITSFLICPGQSVQLEVNGSADGTYNWTPTTDLDDPSIGNPVATPSTTTTYTVTYPDGCGNVVTEQFLVEVDNIPLPPPPLTEVSICTGESIQLFAEQSADGTYNWAPNQDINDSNIQNPTVSPSQTTLYSVTYFDECLNATTAEFNVNVNTDQHSATLEVQDGCENQLLTFTGNGQNQIWDFGDGQSSTTFNPQHNYLNAGNYTVTLISSDDNFCINSDTISSDITIQAPSETAFEADVLEINVTETINFVNSGTSSILNWDFGNGETAAGDNTSHTFMLPGTFEVCANTNQFCLNSFCRTVQVNEVGDIYIPTAFSPNADGQNDVFQVYGTFLERFELRIYNRWGVLLFESDDISKSWDGTYKGIAQDISAYVYFVDAAFLGGRPFVKKGNFTLIR